MAYQTAYNLVRPQLSRFAPSDFQQDKMAVITTLNRIATVSIERIMLMLNNTQMCRIRRLRNIDEALMFLSGTHDDVGLSGDRADFYKRQLADQIHVTFAVQGVTHTNVVSVVEAAISLERETRQVLKSSAISRYSAPTVQIDETILNILARIADVF